MITCKLGNKTYTVDYITGRALREIEPALKMYGHVNRISLDVLEGKDVSGEKVTVPEALDVLIKWFCLLFGNQFTTEDVYENYPSDRLVHDIALSLMAVQNQMTAVLSEFPTVPAMLEIATGTEGTPD
jgi:hypothetical protein